MLNIYRPTLYSTRITQVFGESKACAKKNLYGFLQIPAIITGKLNDNDTCPQGYDDFYKLMGMKGHNGIDIATWHGEPIYHCADFDGIMKTEVDNSGGIGVDVISKKPILDGKYVKIRYWHLKMVVGWDGKEVKSGDTIGLADNTGASSGTHLHFGSKWCDKNGRGIEKDNGFLGAFDPNPYYHHNIFIRDIMGVSSEKLNTAQHLSKIIYIFSELLRSFLAIK